MARDNARLAAWTGGPRGGRTRTSWTPATAPRGGRKKGSRDLIPRSLKASVARVLADLVATEPDLIRRALRRGLAAPPPISLPYLRMAAEYLDGPPPDRLPGAEPLDRGAVARLSSSGRIDWIRFASAARMTPAIGRASRFRPQEEKRHERLARAPPPRVPSPCLPGPTSAHGIPAGAPGTATLGAAPPRLWWTTSRRNSPRSCPRICGEAMAERRLKAPHHPASPAAHSMPA